MIEAIKSLTAGVLLGFIAGLIFVIGMIMGSNLFEEHCWFCTQQRITLELRPNDIIRVGRDSWGAVIRKKAE